LVPIGNTEARSGYYVTIGAAVGRRSFCLHTFGIFREDISIEMHVFLNFISFCHLPKPHPNHFSKLNFISKILNFTMQINAYQEGTKTNTGVMRIFEEYWYALVSKDASTNVLQPSLEIKKQKE